MPVKRSNPKPDRVQPFDPTSTGTLNASDTLKLLALPDTPLPQTPEELGLDALHRRWPLHWANSPGSSASGKRQ
jgi:hypothetical protein